MRRFNADGVFFAFAVIAFVSFMGTQGVSIVNAFQALALSSGFHQVLIVVGTCALGGVVAGLNNRLPNYASRPPASALTGATLPTALAALAGLALMAAAGIRLTAVGELSPLSFWALVATLALNSAAVVTCICYAYSLARQYREACAWEDAIHPA